MNVGEKIKKLRNQKGFSQKELGHLSNTSESTIRKYELGQRNPKIETIQKLSNALGSNELESKTIYTSLLEEAGYIEDNDQINWKDFDSKVDLDALKRQVQMLDKGFDLDVLLDENITLRIDEKPLSKEERKALSLFIEALRELRK